MTVSPLRPRLWPPSPYQLADANRCPSCFAAAAPPLCDSCGLLLDDPRTARAAQLGGHILALELKRQGLLDEVHATQAEAEATLARLMTSRTPVATPAVSEGQDAAASVPVTTLTRDPDPAAVALAASAAPAETVLVPVPAGAGAPAGPPLSVDPPTSVADTVGVPAAVGVPSQVGAPARGAEPPVAASVSAPPREPRRKLSVPILLLIVGVTLVGIAAVFFLVYAWFVFGIEVRALIIGGITLAAIVGASLLRRRALTATAEGIAALGIVLLALDAWAVRANDLFGTGDSDPAIYAGVSALAVGVVCRVWARFSKLRGPDLAGSLALPTGVGFLVGGLFALPSAEAWVAGLLGAAAGGLLHALPAPWSSARAGRDAVPERMVLAIVGVASLVSAAVVAVVLTGSAEAVVLWSTVGVLALGVAHARLLTAREGAEPLPGARVLAGIASSVAVASLGIAGWQLAMRSGEPVYTLLVGPVLAVGTAVAVDLLHARRGGLGAPRVTSAVVAGLSLVSIAFGWLYLGWVALGSDWTIWTTDPFRATPVPLQSPFLALPAAIAISVLLFLAPSLRRPVLRDVRVVTAALILLGAGALPGIPALLVGVAVAIAAAATAILVRSQARAGWIIGATLAAVAAYIVGTAAPWLWLVGTATAIALPLVIRRIVRPAGAASVALVLAPVAVAAISALLAPDALSAVTGLSGDEWQVTVALLQWIALVSLAAAAFVALDDASRAALAVAAYVLVGATLVWTAAGFSFLVDASAPTGALRGVIGDPVAAIVRGAALTAGFVLVTVGRTRLRAPWTYPAAALVAPSLAYAIHETLGLLGVRNLEAVPIVPLAGAVAVIGVGAWAELSRDATKELRMTRLAADLGALATALIVVWPIGSAHVWEVWGLAALGFAGLAATTGWAAPATSPDDDVFATRVLGLPLAAAPRRLFLWPAVGALVLAWWSFLGAGTPGTSFSIEVQAIPAGAVLIAFAGLLVWLRRRVEAAIALATGLAIPLWGLALEGWTGSPLRGTLVAIAATAIALALSAPPLRGIRPVAIAGATTALVGVGLVTVERALDEPPAGAAWLLLLVAAAYASGFGMSLPRAARPSDAAYAVVMPAAALVAAVGGVLASTDTTVVVAVALALLAALHLAAAALDRLPLTAVTRWTAFAGAVAVGGAAFAQGGVDEIEAVSLPIAGMALAGAVLAVLRARRAGDPWPIGESAVWLGGLVLATLPSIIAPAEPVRVWSVIVATLVAAAAACVSRIPDEWVVRVPSALVLGVAAVVMGARGLGEPGLASATAAATTAACGAIAVAVLLVATTRTERATWPPTLLAALGSALLVYIVLDRSDGELATTAVTAVLGGAVGVVGAALLAIRRWSGVGSVLAIAGLVVAVAACAVRFSAVLLQPGLEADFWAIVGGAIAVAILLTGLRAVPARWMGGTAGAVLGLAVVVYAVAEYIALQAQQGLAQPEYVQDTRAVVAMTVLSVAAAVGAALRSRIGWTLVVAGSTAAGMLALAAVVAVGIAPIELVSVPPALVGIAYGSVRLARTPGLRSWPALGPWLALLTLPSLLHDFGESELWRVVALGVVAIALVVVGAVLKLQAPLLLGSAVVVVHAVAQLWPWIREGYTAVPWWLWLGIGGALLIFLAATYERRVRQLKSAFVAVSSLR